jgi:hypothetical protein
MSTAKCVSPLTDRKSLCSLAQQRQFLIDTGDPAHALPDGLEGRHGLSLAAVATDQLKDRPEPFLRQLVHQVVKLVRIALTRSLYDEGPPAPPDTDGCPDAHLVVAQFQG